MEAYDIKRKFIRVALGRLGKQPTNDHTWGQYHHQIFGMFLAALEINASTDDLAEIERVSTSLWLWRGNNISLKGGG